MAKYPDFKSYIQAKFADYLTQEVHNFVSKNHDGLGFHSYSVLSLCEETIENLLIKSINCSQMPGYHIKININITADIVTYGLGTKKYSTNRKQKWFTIHTIANLREGMSFEKEHTCVEEFTHENFDKSTALDEFLVPYIYSSDLEEIAEDFTDFYCADAIYDGYQFPFEHVLQQLEMDAITADLPENTMGRMYFRDGVLDVYQKPYATIPEQKYNSHVVKAGTLVINHNSGYFRIKGQFLLTVAHEIFHWYYHQAFFRILALLNDEETNLQCDAEPFEYTTDMSSIKKALWFVEWQANAIGMRIAMPKELFLRALDEAYIESLKFPHFQPYQAHVMEDVIKRTAELFGVSEFTAKQRAIQLGYDVAEGTFVYINDRYVGPYSFKLGSLKKNQTFIIDEESLLKICASDIEFAGLLESELFIYIDGVVCIAVNKYAVYMDDIDRYMLTDYAKDHLDECCLIFYRDFKTTSDGSDYELYGLSYLSQHVKASLYCESKKVDEDTQDKKERALELSKINEEGERIMEIYSTLPSTFAGTLDAHIKRHRVYNPHTNKMGKMTNLELASRTGYSEDYIAQLRKDGKNVSMNAVCAICVALHLHPFFSRDLIKKSKNDFTDDAEGFLQSYIIEHHFNNKLSYCNELLQEAGFKPWGKIS